MSEQSVLAVHLETAPKSGMAFTRGAYVYTTANEIVVLFTVV